MCVLYSKPRDKLTVSPALGIGGKRQLKQIVVATQLYSLVCRIIVLMIILIDKKVLFKKTLNI